MVEEAINHQWYDVSFQWESRRGQEAFIMWGYVVVAEGMSAPHVTLQAYQQLPVGSIEVYRTLRGSSLQVRR